MSEADYRGLAAQVYDLWHPYGSLGDEEFYRDRIAAAGGRALEVACGTGRLLVPYRKAGLEVEGIDASPEMLALCRAKAAAAGVDVTLHQGRMQDLDLGRRFSVIYVPFRSFKILSDRAEALATLRRFYDHLEEGGTLLISLFVPSYAMTIAQHGQWEVIKTVPFEDGLVHISQAVTNDCVEQLKEIAFRYEQFRGEQLERTELQLFTIRWYFTYEFQLLLEKVGFRDVFAHGDYTDEPVRDGHDEMTFRARRGGVD